MMRQMKWLALAAMLVSVSSAFAQPPGRGPGGGGRPGSGQGGFFGQREGGFGGGGGKFGLLTNPAVQEELALSDEQKQKIREVAQSYREALRPAVAGGFEELRDLPPEERRAKMQERAQEANETRKKVDAEFAPKYTAVLDDVQVTRLQQIHWQVQGVNALQDEELAKALNLSQEQRDKLKTVSEEFSPFRGAQAGGRRDGPPPSEEERQARRQEMEERVQKRQEALLGVLTPEQKAQYEKLKGAEFDVGALRRGNRGPGGPGGEGGRRGGNRQNQSL